jgi:cell wall-associated NlpC family hydrolase
MSCAGVGLAACPTLDAQVRSAYRSPYRLRFRHAISELEAGIHAAPWSSAKLESAVPPHEWFSRRVLHKYGAWGPPARQYPAPPALEQFDLTWMQDRVIHAASRWINYPYQHHHIPDWDPPAGWPWHKVAFGRNSRGIDCSNFSSFCFNYALGIKLDTAIRAQAERREVRGPGGKGILSIGVVERANYDALIGRLLPADLLYIRNDRGRLSHVILWLGEVGVSPDGTPLILDSTGPGHRDSSGVPIPCGVHIRPFSRDSWYARDLSHAHRIIRGVHQTREGEVAEAEEGGALIP